MGENEIRKTVLAVGKSYTWQINNIIPVKQSVMSLCPRMQKRLFRQKLQEYLNRDLVNCASEEFNHQILQFDDTLILVRYYDEVRTL